LYVQGDNARQRATLIPGALPDVEMCLTLPHIQKLKKNFSMELTIIETSAYQELRKLVSTLAYRWATSRKRLPRLRRTSEWMRRTYVWLWVYRNGACKTIGTTG